MATETELSRDADAALAAVDARMIEAEKDRRMVGALRDLCDESPMSKRMASSFFARLDEWHEHIYGTPCTASAKTEGK